MSIRALLNKKKSVESYDEGHRYRDDRPVAPPPAHDESNWLVSYADMMTLLCGFFIMLFSMAKLDAPQYEKVKEAVSKQFGGQYQAPGQEMAKMISQVAREAGIESQVVVKPEPAGVAVIFESTLFFDTLDAAIKPAGTQVIEKLIQGIAARQKKDVKAYRIVVEGHTDSRPIVSGIYPSNWELSAARASRVIRMFLDRGFAPDQLTAIGYADTRPVAGHARAPSGDWDEAALARDRRVVVRILEPDAAILAH